MPLSPNRILPLSRLVVFGTVSFFSFIVLVISAHIVNLTGGSLNFAGLGVATAVLSLLSLPVMLFVGRIRVAAVPSWIAVEVGWTGFLWIMWLATAGTTASVNHSGGNCGVGIRGFSTFCGEVNAVEAFAFLNWIMLLIYFVALLVFTIRSQQAGNARIWTTSVNEADFEGGSSYGYTRNKNNVLQPSSVPQYPPAQA